MHQIYHAVPTPLMQLRTNVSESLNDVIMRSLAKNPQDRHADWRAFSQALSDLIADHQVPRTPMLEVLDSERFNLLRTLDFFSSFGDVELWEVVHRGKWQRFTKDHYLFRKGEEGMTFYIIAQGEIEVHRDNRRVAVLGAGTSVGEMAYLAPSPELRRHSTDIIVTQDATTLSFLPESMDQLSPSCKHRFDEAFIRVLVRRLHTAHEALAHPRRIF